jgi:predicted DNA-binding transcriptional regulator YafY
MPDGDGWVTLDLPFESFVAARSRLLGLGRAVEVLEPESLRKSLVDFAEQIVLFYKK